MKSNILKLLFLGVIATAATSCSTDDTNFINPAEDFSGTYSQIDQMGRPAINTVFVNSGAPKDAYNLALPSTMGTTYKPVFKLKLMALNPGYTTNALGLDADTFSTVLATDVLNVKTTGLTTFFDGTNVLTGRNLGDDVIDTELLLIFGGPSGTSNPTLTKDNVNGNDKAFLTSFPYMASPW